MKRGSSDWLTRRATTCPAPTRTLPTLPAASWATSRSASCSVTRALSARARSAAPIGVSSTPRGARTNSRAPTWASSRCRLRVSAGWLMPRVSAARARLRDLADREEILEFPVQQRHAQKLSNYAFLSFEHIRPFRTINGCLHSRARMWRAGSPARVPGRSLRARRDAAMRCMHRMHRYLRVPHHVRPATGLQSFVH